MDNKFSPSVNIKRDLDKSFDYIQTPNAERVFEQLDNNYSTGQHSFNIIGSFGTGKSSFLLAFQKQLTGENTFFEFAPTSFNGQKKYEFVNIIGEYGSIMDAFSRAIGSDHTDKELLIDLEEYYKSHQKENKRLVFVVDEFGKFLEYAAANNPEKELYFVQQVSEFINDVHRDILLITTLHQNFQAYTTELTHKQRMEWEKVKGRFKEIAFNEPVEQLLYLAAKFLHAKPGVEMPAEQESLIEAILKANAFPLDNQFIDDMAIKLLPFDVISAAVLTLSLQKYGQNERSLFSFLKSNDISGLEDYDKQSNPYYNSACVYDYLIKNFYSFLCTRYNPDYLQWTAIRSALERAETITGENCDDASKLIKTIGLLNLFASKGIRLDREFLTTYSGISLGVKEPDGILEILESRKIIRYQSFKDCYVLFEGTDLDIDLAIKEAESHIDLPTDIVPILNENFQFPYVLAKAVFFETGTQRQFEIVLSDHPVTTAPTGITDGIINIIINENIDETSIKELSGKCGDAIMYGLYRNPAELRDIIWEIEKEEYVLSDNTDDRVVQKELNLQISILKNNLNHKISGAVNASSDNLVWYFQGKAEDLKKKRDFYRALSRIAEDIYYKAPHYKNELINRHNLSSNIPLARKNLFIKLVEKWQEEDLGFPLNNYPPEKTVYLSLLKHTGIHREDENGFWSLSSPQEESFGPLWKECEAFLNSTRNRKTCITELIDILSGKPFKLKQGFMEFWVPVFLFVKRDSFALFLNDSYVPELDADMLLIMTRDPGKYFIKAFDIKGIRLELFNNYRRLLDKESASRLTNISFVDTIRPFLIFYKSLPEYAKRTKRLSPQALALRDAIAKSKDPEKTFFNDFPNAFGYTIENLTASPKNLERFIHQLRDGIQEIKTCFTDLLERIEKHLKKQLDIEVLGFPEYRNTLQERYKSLKEHLLLRHQKIFYQRLHSPLDDRFSWLQSIIQAVLGRNVESVNDIDEEIANSNLKRMIFELDNLNELAELQYDRDKEEVFKIQVTTPAEGTKENLIRFTKAKAEKNPALKTKIKKVLTTDTGINIAVLVDLLKEQLPND